MSWRWSRLAILAFLALLYASPLSSGDKGLWLSVASMPVPPFGALPERTPPEHAILLPDRAQAARSQACVMRSEPSLGAGLVAVDATIIVSTTAAASDPAAWASLDATCPAPSAPRGPPV